MRERWASLYQNRARRKRLIKTPGEEVWSCKLLPGGEPVFKCHVTKETKRRIAKTAAPVKTEANRTGKTTSYGLTLLLQRRPADWKKKTISKTREKKRVRWVEGTKLDD